MIPVFESFTEVILTKLFIGIDLGTSAVKLLLVDEKGTIHKEVNRDYPLYFPQPGWSEQDPADWWAACVDGMKELLAGADASAVAGIGCGGQMHGLVVLDEKDAVIRRAILWNDGRTQEEVDFLNEGVGRDRLSALTANIAFAGFTAPKILWMKKHEPEAFARIAKIMLPKDYINYRLTGVHCCDYSDASGMLLLDVKNRRWSREMLEICGVSEAQMPKLFESFEPVGTLLPEIAQALGLPASVKVVAGAGDNAAAAVGTGVVGSGGCNISLGTSGTIFISSDRFGVDPNNALHAFAHADGGYHLMGCMLSAASCNKWLCDDILKTTDYAAEQADITDDRLGRNHVFFLPYLMGERSPINDVNARGTFWRAWPSPSATALRSRVLSASTSRAASSAAAAPSPRCGGRSSPTSWASPWTWTRPSRAPDTAVRCSPWWAAASTAACRSRRTRWWSSPPPRSRIPNSPRAMRRSIRNTGGSIRR